MLESSAVADQLVPAFTGTTSWAPTLPAVRQCYCVQLKQISHWPAGLGFAQRGAGFGEPAQYRGRRPALAILLVPRLDLAVHLAYTNAVRPVHQPAAVAREAKAVEPHHVDVAGAVGLALVEDLAGLVDRGEEQPAQDLLVGEIALRDAEFRRPCLDSAGEFGMRSAVAFLVAEPSGPGLRSERRRAAR